MALAQGGPLIDPGVASAVAGDMATPDGALHLRTTAATAGLTGQDYAAILDAAWTRYRRAQDFRSHELQHFDPVACIANPDDPAVCTRAVTGATTSYLDVDAGRLYWRYCADYDEAYVGTQATLHDEDDPGDLLQIDMAGRCPRWSDLSAGQQARRVTGGDLNLDADSRLAMDVRNDLLTAFQYFSVLVAAQPADLAVDYFTGVPALLQPGADGEPERVRDVGIYGLRATVNEIATAHMIFGHDFFNHALALPANSAANAVDQLAAQQVLLTRAQRQYELAATTLILTANRQLGLTSAPTVVDLLGPAEFRLLDDALSALAETEVELAAHTRLLELDAGTTAQTDATLFEAQRTDFPLLSALHASTQPITASLSAHNIAGLVDAQRDLRSDLTPLGYPADYAAQESFSALIDVLCGGEGTCDGGMLAATTVAFETLATDPHEYDRTLTAVTAEMDQVVTELKNELILLCGEPLTGNWGEPDGCGPYAGDGDGLLAATYADLVHAAERVALTRRTVAALPDQLLLAQEQAGRVIPITIGSQNEAESYLQAVAAANAYKITDSIISPLQAAEIMTGTAAQTTTLAILTLGQIDPSAVRATFNDALTQQPTTLSPVTYLWAPAMGAPADFSTDVAWQAALQSAQMADDAASNFVRKLLQRQAMLLVEERLAFDNYNALAQQWNRQVRRYAHATAQLARAEGATSTALLVQPHFRVVHSGAQMTADRQFDEAKRMAYLAATAYAGAAMQPFAGLNELERVQNPAQLRAVVETLIGAHQALPTAPRTRQTIRISLAEDMAGLPPVLLDPPGALDAIEMALLRDSYWQTMLAGWDVGGGKLVIPITITPFDLPLPETARAVHIADPTELGCADDCRGVWVNLNTVAPHDDIDEAAIALAHHGHSAARMASQSDWLVDLQPATLLSHPRPPTLSPARAEITGTGTIDAAEPQQPAPEVVIDAFNGLSPAAANWQLEIDLASAGLELSTLRDIELYMDVSYVTTSEANAASAEMISVASARSSDEPVLTNGSVYQGVMVTDPPTSLPGYDMVMTFEIDHANPMTGTLCTHCTPELGQTISLVGGFDPADHSLSLASQPVSRTLHARTATQTVRFDGVLSNAGVISGSFASTLTGYIAAPLMLSGPFIAVQLTGSDLAAAKTLNQAPITGDDHFSVAPASVDNRLDLVANDVDPDGDPGADPNGRRPRLAFISQPANGKVQLADNQVDYTPNPQFTGKDTFHYVVTDGRLFAVGQVTVEVTTGETFIYLPLINSRQ